MSFYPASFAQRYKFTFSTRCRCFRLDKLSQNSCMLHKQRNKHTNACHSTIAFRIESSCDAPETTKVSTWLQQCVYIAIRYNRGTLACTPLYASRMLLAPSYPWSRKKFESSPSLDKSVNMQSARASTVVEVSRTKHKNFYKCCFL